MKGKNYTKEFKEALLQEVNECNNVAQVAVFQGDIDSRTRSTTML